ncbi:MAG TPA: cupredoxin domain-containing protein [Gemmatimonadales bacterium]|nr:cupredoxin domain-containing protein [Gemmatimonadales bacterium]
MTARLLGALLASAAVAACFSMHEPSTDEVGVSCERAAQPPGPDSAFVVIRDFAFQPAALTVPEGTTVIWVNCEDAEGTPGHTTTSDAWDSPTLTPGQSFAVTPAAGSYPYHCRPHPFMEGSVTVSELQSLTSARR